MFDVATVNLNFQTNATKPKGVVQEIGVYVGNTEERFSTMTTVSKGVVQNAPTKEVQKKSQGSVEVSSQAVTEVRVGDVS